MDPTLWLTFSAASLALLLIPGPTVLLVLSYALAQGRRVAIACAAGVALGDLLAMSISLIGLGALMATSATAFMVLKWLGAAYLLWLGLRMLRRAAQEEAAAHVNESGTVEAQQVFVHAALVTVLNPKSIGFFIAFVPQFIRPDAAFAPQALILTVTFVSLAALNALAYALLADLLRRRLARPQTQRRLAQVGGLTLITMGALAATARRGSP